MGSHYVVIETPVDASGRLTIIDPGLGRMDVCHRFAIIDAGRIVFDGSEDTINAEATRLAQSAPDAGRGLERVFLEIAAKGRTVGRLQTLAQPAPRSDSHAH